MSTTSKEKQVPMMMIRIIETALFPAEHVFSDWTPTGGGTDGDDLGARVVGEMHVLHLEGLVEVVLEGLQLEDDKLQVEARELVDESVMVLLDEGLSLRDLSLGHSRRRRSP